ncbi:unnamed protein product [Arctia plantaginis]|uniref:Uncharacterized protein n=1 Tax=Arctia plantaginis TaxID=874455 RepID=A0A8S1A3Q5_ARCPL|nr:unnamed protein product [Arctia plantaginis]
MTLASRGQCEISDDYLKNTKSLVKQNVTDDYDDIYMIKEKIYPRVQLETDPGEHWSDSLWRKTTFVFRTVGEAVTVFGRMYGSAIAWCKKKLAQLIKFSYHIAIQTDAIRWNATNV